MLNQARIFALAATSMLLFCANLGLTLPSATAAETTKALGTVKFPVSCSPAAQNKFERGLALLHHMMYMQAEK